MSKWFQKLYYKESIQAIKDSLDFIFFDNFKNTIILSLPQASKNSRERIASNILNRFYKDKNVNIFMAKVWQNFNNESLLKELFRYYFLINEPIIEEFYLNNIYNKSEGSIISSKIFEDFIETKYSKKEKNLIWWLQAALRDLSFIKKIDEQWKVTKVVPAERAFLLLTYELFLNTCNEVTLDEIYNNDFWKLLGIRTKEEVNIIITKSTLLNIINLENEKIKPIKTLQNLLELGINVLN